MLERGMFVLTFAAAIGSGLVAGIFFAFSSFVMAALSRLPPADGSAAMQSINVTVINPGFFLAFFGTAILCVVLAFGTYLWIDQPRGWLILAASAIYLIGCIGVTMVCNVPLNDALAAAQAGTPDGVALWSRYLGTWTWWNTVRTAASGVSAVLFTAGMILQ